MKTILIIGASSDLGYALAKKCLKMNYFVILHYFQNKEKLAKLHEEYQEQSMLLKANIRIEKEVEDLFKKIYKKHEKIDILINNAGIDHVSDITSKTKQTFMNIFEVNTIGPFLTMKNYCENTEQGKIINISSDNAIDRNDPITMEYDVSKVGLNMLTKDFALVYQNIKINALCFGWIDTKMNDIAADIKKHLEMFSPDEAADKIIEYFEFNNTGKIEIVRKK